MTSMMLAPWKKSHDQPRQHIQKQRHYFVNKGPSSQGYCFSSGHVWMQELDCEESWVPKNWCFWTVVLDTLGDQPWVLFGRKMLKLKLQCFGHLMQRVDSLEDSDAGRDWGQEEKGTTEDEMAGWHHWLDGHESEWTLGDGDGQGGLVCCDSWGRKELDATDRLN